MIKINVKKYLECKVIKLTVLNQAQWIFRNNVTRLLKYICEMEFSLEHIKKFYL